LLSQLLQELQSQLDDIEYREADAVKQRRRVEMEFGDYKAQIQRLENDIKKVFLKNIDVS
jgi:phage shock protein A